MLQQLEILMYAYRNVMADVSEMPWTDTDFDDMKRFMLDVIEGARRKDGWGFLDYQPNEDLLFPCLDQFYKLISDMDLRLFHQEAAQKWLHDTMDVPDVRTAQS